MSKLKLGILVGTILLLVSAISYATTPPPSITLEEWVSRATHIFVGEARNMRIVSSDGSEVRPEPLGLSLEEKAELTVKTHEVLWPKNWGSSSEITVLFGGGMFEVEKIRNDLVGEKVIYITRISEENPLHFLPAYPWHLFQSLEMKDRISNIIEKNKGD